MLVIHQLSSLDLYNPCMVDLTRVHVSRDRNARIMLRSTLGYIDSDFSGYRNTRKATSGHVFVIAGGPLSWRSEKNTVIALWISEVLYIASFSEAKEAVWVSSLVGDMCGIAMCPITLITHDLYNCTCQLAPCWQRWQCRSSVSASLALLSCRMCVSRHLRI